MSGMSEKTMNYDDDRMYNLRCGESEVVVVVVVEGVVVVCGEASSDGGEA